jgi:hypothetical protein|tara:strand:- start:4123 stop:4224 length:102 start_codon:yes stop_codon:yes gene_type:complete
MENKETSIKKIRIQTQFISKKLNIYKTGGRRKE